MKKDGVSKYKLDRIATESLRNSLRLLFDSILLFNNESYPSAFQLAVLSLEELSKAKWIEHYMYSSETNTGYPGEEFEHLQVTETPGQLLLQANTAEQRLVHHQSSKRGQSLIFKFDLGNAVGFTMSGGFATLHVNGLFWLSYWIGVH